MSAHTPRPWKTQDDADGALYIVGGGGTIAQVTSTHANARLIAAAPRMLDALKGCLGYFEDMKNAGINAAWCMPDEKWLASIRAILRDVEGESHE